MQCNTLRHDEAGFTLIEVMLVVFIIGLSAGVVVLSLPERADPARQALDDFVKAVHLARDQAVLSGAPIGLSLSEEGYSLQSWQQGKWQEMRLSSRLGESLDVRLISHGSEVTRADLPGNWPDLMFDPTGVGSSALLRVRAGGQAYDVSLTELGEVTVDAR